MPESDEIDSEAAFMPFVLNVKSRKCQEGESRVCFGFHLAMGIAPFELKGDDLGPVFVQSVAHMLREISSARMIVVRLSGTSTCANGRASAIIRLASPSKKRANGKCRRQFDRSGNASRKSDRLA